jgi:hypothetical protein
MPQLLSACLWNRCYFRLNVHHFPLARKWRDGKLLYCRTWVYARYLAFIHALPRGVTHPTHYPAQGHTRWTTVGQGCFHAGDFESDDYSHTISLYVGSNEGLHTMGKHDSNRSEKSDRAICAVLLYMRSNASIHTRHGVARFFLY